MKISFLTFLFAFLSASALQAQFYNTGMDRRLGGPGSVPQGPRPDKDKKPIDYVQVSADRMETELKLDALQKAVIKEALGNYYKVATSLQTEDIPAEGKYTRIKAEADKMDKKIIEILNPDQKTKYLDMKARKAAKGKKKGKGKKTGELEEEPDLTKLDSLMMGN